MLQIVTLNSDSGTKMKLFIAETNSGNSAKDVFHVPGVYSRVMEEAPSTNLGLLEMSGSIGEYRTHCYGLVVTGEEQVIDLTPYIQQLLSAPDTAAKSILSRYDDYLRDSCTVALEVIKMYEGVHPGERLCLPPEALSGIPEEMRQSMVSVRKSYTLKGTENQEIFQTSFDSEFGVILPSIADIHNEGDDLVSALDVLRVTAPFRRAEAGGMYAYSAVYHTPFYRADPAMRDFVPSYFQWISGYPANNMLDIQGNERHMANNLKLLLCADITRYVESMVTGLFFTTKVGSIVYRLCGYMEQEVALALQGQLAELNVAGCACTLKSTDVTALADGGWNTSDVVRTILDNLDISDEYITNLIANTPNDRRCVECGRQPFTIPLSDSQSEKYSELLIANGYTTTSMRKFLVQLCSAAYRVNWGHTGAANAIPGMNIRGDVAVMSRAMAKYTQERMAERVVQPTDFPELYIIKSGESDVDDDFSDDIAVRCDYYLTDESAVYISNSSDMTSDRDIFNTPLSPAASTEAQIIERWRNVKGDSNLDNFLSSAMLQTADPVVFIQSFCKLMRWGDRKPSLLVLQDHPEIRFVFDLNAGEVVANSAIMDESELVQVNGCDYSLVGFLRSDSNASIDRNSIIGFVLQKDYGTVRKTYLSSWADIGEMVHSGKINIGDFVGMSKVDISAGNTVLIEDFAREDYEFYVSDSNIALGMELRTAPKDLSALALLVRPGIMDTTEYLRSLRNEQIVTTRDRQYDILRRYAKTISEFYTKHGGQVSAVSNTVELSGVADIFYGMWLASGSKEDANTTTAAANLQRLSLGEDSEVTWDVTPLEGKCFLIEDREMKSILPPIEFSDVQLKNVANSLRNRVVMLLLPTPDKFIFCRKDISLRELIVSKVEDPATGKQKVRPAIKAYSAFSNMVSGLQKNVPCTINGKPAVLHESLRDLL